MTDPATPPDERPRRRSLPFLLLYALAYGGGVMAYVPLLTLILPQRVEALTGEGKIGLLSIATLVGALAASLGNIGAGMLSDRIAGGPHGRRPWIAAGLVCTLLSYAVFHLSATPAALVASVVAFQLSLNLMLAPLLASAADEIPDAQKGLVGGLFGAAYPFGALAGVAITVHAGLNQAGQLAVVGLFIVVAMAPFLLVRRGPAALQPTATSVAARKVHGRRNLALVWVARLLIQVAGSILFAYMFYYFETVEIDGVRESSRDLAARLARLGGLAALATVPLAILLGRLSDVTGERKLFLTATAAAATCGLLVMAALPVWPFAAIGYVLFAIPCAVFLSLQSTYAMELLPSSDRRGRDLGILNLTNTIPAVVATSMAYALAKAESFTTLLLVLAGLTAVGGGLTLLVRHERS